MVDIHLVVRLVAAITGLHAVYSSLELFGIRDRYQDGGMMNWRVSRVYLNGTFGISLIEPLLKNIMTTVTARTVLGVAVIAAAGLDLSFLLIGTFGALLFLTDVVLVYRHGGGLSGAYQMSLVVNAGVAIAAFAPANSLIQFGAVAFIAVQGVLGYFISGAVKAVGDDWRRGDAAMLVLSTATWGHPWAYEQAKKYPRLASLASRGTVVFEIAFPIVLFASPPVMAVIMGAAIAMHLSISFTMGVNGFLTSFTATYPAIYYISTKLPTVV